MAQPTYHLLDKNGSNNNQKVAFVLFRSLWNTINLGLAVSCLALVKSMVEEVRNASCIVILAYD